MGRDCAGLYLPASVQNKGSVTITTESLLECHQLRIRGEAHPLLLPIGRRRPALTARGSYSLLAEARGLGVEELMERYEVPRKLAESRASLMF